MRMRAIRRSAGTLKMHILDKFAFFIFLDFITRLQSGTHIEHIFSFLLHLAFIIEMQRKKSCTYNGDSLGESGRQTD